MTKNVVKASNFDFAKANSHLDKTKVSLLKR